MFESLDVPGRLDHSISGRECVEMGMFRNLSDYLAEKFKESKLHNDDVFNLVDKLDQKFKKQNICINEFQEETKKQLEKQQNVIDRYLE